MNNMSLAELICRQTSYTLEETEQKLKQHNNDVFKVLCDLLPLDIYDRPWLRFDKKYSEKSIKICGKWVLYFNDKSLMNEVWKVAIKSLMEDKLYGVYRLECSTNYVGQTGKLCPIGMLIFVCDVSPNEENEEIILNVGKNILEIFNYDERQSIYYKSKQYYITETSIPNLKNYTYKLDNHLYKRLFRIEKEE